MALREDKSLLSWWDSERFEVYKEQVGPDVPATEKGKEELEEIEKVLEKAEEDLDDIKDGIDDRIKCFSYNLLA